MSSISVTTWSHAYSKQNKCQACHSGYFHHNMIMAHFLYVVTGHWRTQSAKHHTESVPSLILVNAMERQRIAVTVDYYIIPIDNNRLSTLLKTASETFVFTLSLDIVFQTTAALYTVYKVLLNQILLEGYDDIVQVLCHGDGHHSFAENMIQIIKVLYHYNSDKWSGQLKWVNVGKLHDTKLGVQRFRTFLGLCHIHGILFS